VLAVLDLEPVPRRATSIRPVAALRHQSPEGGNTGWSGQAAARQNLDWGSSTCLIVPEQDRQPHSAGSPSQRHSERDCGKGTHTQLRHALFPPSQNLIMLNFVCAHLIIVCQFA
jgi:hypothetical protein